MFSFLKKLFGEPDFYRDSEETIKCPGDKCIKTKCTEECPIDLNTKALVLMGAGKVEEAVQKFEKAIGLAPDFKDAWNNVGACYGMQGNHKRALECYQKAYKLDPQYGKALMGMIIANRDMKNYEEAFRLYEEYEKKFRVDNRIKYQLLRLRKGIEKSDWEMAKERAKAADAEKKNVEERNRPAENCQDSSEKHGKGSGNMGTSNSSGNKPTGFLDPRRFYVQCMKDFHDVAQKSGFAPKGAVMIPELAPIGTRTVMSFLRDQELLETYGDDPVQWYYAIVGLSIQAGIVFGYQWHVDYSGLNEAYISSIIDNGPAEIAGDLMMQVCHKNQIEANDYYSSIFSEWLRLHDPYWNMTDPRQYTFNATLAAFQVGVSTILGEFGF